MSHLCLLLHAWCSAVTDQVKKWPSASKTHVYPLPTMVHCQGWHILSHFQILFCSFYHFNDQNGLWSASFIFEPGKVESGT